jgi:hypothetical protein
MARADVCTGGEFLTEVGTRSHLKAMTVRRYAVKLPKLVSDVAHAAGAAEWRRLVKPRLTTVGSVFVFDRPIVFEATKDRPVLLSAIGGNAEYLVTSDTTDFAHLLGTVVYGMKVRTPKTFLQETGIVR